MTSLSASAVVAAGPATLAPKSSRNAFRASPTSGESPRIVAGVRQGETAGMPEHVRVDRKRHPIALAEACDQCVEALGRHRASALRREHVRARRLLALQAAQGTDLVTLDRVAQPILGGGCDDRNGVDLCQVENSCQGQSDRLLK